MPYIKQEHRIELNPLSARTPLDPGGLNFQITQLIRVYLHEKGINYVTLNEIVGALECAKLEFTRRVVVPYENTKIATNGDVYT